MASPLTKLSTLLEESSIIDDKEALQIADDALKISRDIVALHTRVVALIKLDRYQEALLTLSDNEDKLFSRCLLEKAYALYKTGNLTEAELLLQKVNNRGLKHVAAQIAYRAGKFALAINHLKALSAEKSLNEGEDIDLIVNISATNAQLEWQRNRDQIKQDNCPITTDDQNLFEISFNNACKYIARQDFKTACVLLKRARDQCEVSDTLDEDEKNSEILPIILQQAYALLRLGNHQEAKVLHRIINITDLLEPPTKAIANNNFLISTPNENPFTAQRILSSITYLTATEQLFWYQTNILQRNKFTVNIKAQKYSYVVNSTSKIISNLMPTLSIHHNLLSVLNAAAYARNKTGKSGLKAILLLLEKRSKDVGLILTVVQLCFLANKLSQAILHLEKFLRCLENSQTPTDLDIRYAPGLIALLVSLYRLSGRKKPIKSALTNAALYWCSKSSPEIPILRAARILLMKSTNIEDLNTSTIIFKSIRDRNPNDRIANTGYIASCVSEDFDPASSDLDKLTPVSRLISDINIEALENDGITSLLPSQSCKKRNVKVENIPTKKRRLSKRRMPKNFEDNKKVDPERWLAMRDRSVFRQGGRKNKTKMLELTQGGITKEKENVLMVSSVEAVKFDKTVITKGKKKRGKK